MAENKPSTLTRIDKLENEIKEISTKLASVETNASQASKRANQAANNAKAAKDAAQAADQRIGSLNNLATSISKKVNQTYIDLDKLSVALESPHPAGKGQEELLEELSANLTAIRRGQERDIEISKRVADRLGVGSKPRDPILSEADVELIVASISGRKTRDDGVPEHRQRLKATDATAVSDIISTQLNAFEESSDRLIDTMTSVALNTRDLLDATAQECTMLISEASKQCAESIERKEIVLAKDAPVPMDEPMRRGKKREDREGAAPAGTTLTIVAIALSIASSILSIIAMIG